MLPIERGGTLVAVRGQQQARAYPRHRRTRDHDPARPHCRSAPGRRPLSRLPLRARRRPQKRSSVRCARRTGSSRSCSPERSRVARSLGSVKVGVVACYELGHQPLHVATVAACLRAPRARRPLRRPVRRPVGRRPGGLGRPSRDSRCRCTPRCGSARRTIESLHAERPDLPDLGFGLYAPVLVDVATRVVAGETDESVVAWVEDRLADSIVHLGRGDAGAGSRPARDLLPPLDRYVRLVVGVERRIVASTEASHGCAHRCRHCPVPVVYDGRIRIVDGRLGARRRRATGLRGRPAPHLR